MEADEGLQHDLAARGLVVSFSPDKGRGLFATRDFSPGEVIIDQDPYASTPQIFSSSPACDGCFATSNLKRCSSCKIAWYCGNICQKSEWNLHHLECEAFKTLSDGRRKMLTPTIRLMVRLLLKRKLQNGKARQFPATDNYDLVKALVSHISDIDDKQLVLYAQMANLVNLVIPLSDISIREVTENFSRLACNAHTICDNELRPLGIGLYPVISIINHSCLPNSVLVFEGRIATVRALEHIASGSEIFISYIETAAAMSERRNSLKEQYFFTCMCWRCSNANPLEESMLEGYRCSDAECDGPLLYDSVRFSCQKCGRSWDQRELNKALKEQRHLSELAHQSLLQHNNSEAQKLYKALEKNQDRLFHPLSLPLLDTRDKIMKISMELKDWNDALTYCRLTLPAYLRVYPANHPMVGLQFYTCGKLEWLLGHTEAALRSLTKAADVLRIAYGTGIPFTRALLSKLEEVRAEATYKCRSNEEAH